MTNNTTMQETEAAIAAAETKGKAPTHIAYHVRNYSDDKASWTSIGAVWPHQDGNGFSLRLDCVPFDGRLELRKVTDKKSSTQ